MIIHAPSGIMLSVLYVTITCPDQFSPIIDFVCKAI